MAISVFYKIKNLLDEGTRSLKEMCFEVRLPNFVKFTGDGVLLIWDLRDHNYLDLDYIHIRKIIETLRQVCQAYHWPYFKKIAGRFANYPEGLRCSITQGQVVSLGQGKEYVGQCINLASRLVKNRRLSFVIAQNGIDLEKDMNLGNPREAIVTKKLNIDGIGYEIIYILEKEFADLSPEEQEKFISI